MTSIVDSQRHCAYGRCTHGKPQLASEAATHKARAALSGSMSELHMNPEGVRQNYEHDSNNVVSDALACDYFWAGLAQS